MSCRLARLLFGAVALITLESHDAVAAPPTVPQQHDLVPILRATPILVRLGMPNPKGAEYCEVEISINDGFKKTRNVKTHGWVAATDKGHAICWNGQTYPLVKAGSAANLRTDLADMMADCKRPNDGSAKIMSEADAKSHVPSEIDWRTCDQDKIPMLICLGEQDSASRLWTAIDSQTHPGPQGKPDEWYRGQITKDFIKQYLNQLSTRAAYAHANAHDEEALEYSRKFVDALRQPEVIAIAKDENNSSELGSEMAKEILTDQLRRKSEQGKSQAAPPANADKATQVSYFIDQLDEITAHPEGAPSSMCMDNREAYDGLIKLGPAAVEPLIDVLDKDKRLTRIAEQGRPWWPPDNITPVSRIAYQLLPTLIGKQFSEPEDNWEIGRQKIANQMRKFWSTAKTETREKRWLRVLADDRAGREEWIDAANNIVTFVKDDGCASSTGAASYVDTSMPMLIGDRSLGGIRGEPLRTVMNPSVSDLMLKRAWHMWKSGDSENQNAAIHVMMDLAVWDGPHQIAELKRFSDTVAATGRYRLPKWDQFESGAEILGAIYEARFASGDQTALSDYFKMVRSTPPKNVEDLNLFTFIFHNYDKQAVRQQTELLFTDPKSAWNPKLLLSANPTLRPAVVKAIKTLKQNPPRRYSEVPE